jgi:phosphoglycerate kinase
MKLENLPLKGKRVLMRVDFNVPLNANYEVTDDTRISAALATINFILDQGASLILMSHLGRPEKKLKADGSLDREKFTMMHTVSTLSKLLGKPVNFVDDTIGEKVKAAAAALKSGEVLLLENTRFYKEESKGDEAFAKELAAFSQTISEPLFAAPDGAGIIVQNYELQFVGKVHCFFNGKKTLVSR